MHIIQDSIRYNICENKNDGWIVIFSKRLLQVPCNLISNKKRIYFSKITLPMKNVTLHNQALKNDSSFWNRDLQRDSFIRKYFVFVFHIQRFFIHLDVFLFFVDLGKQFILCRLFLLEENWIYFNALWKVINL